MCCIRPGRAPPLQRCNNHMSLSHLSERLLRGQFEEITFFSRHRCKKTRAPTLGRLSQSSFSGRGRKTPLPVMLCDVGRWKEPFSPFVILIWPQIPHNNMKSFMSNASAARLSSRSCSFGLRFRPEFLCFRVRRNHFLWVFITLKVERSVCLFVLEGEKLTLDRCNLCRSYLFAAVTRTFFLPVQVLLCFYARLS